jgi:hypothetical protein
VPVVLNQVALEREEAEPQVILETEELVGLQVRMVLRVLAVAPEAEVPTVVPEVVVVEPAWEYTAKAPVAPVVHIILQVLQQLQKVVLVVRMVRLQAVLYMVVAEEAPLQRMVQMLVVAV